MNGDRILLVEDDKEIREGVEIFLKSQGYAVFQAADGVEGLKVLEEREIDLAIVDVMMPRMDGITMTAKLREKYDFQMFYQRLPGIIDCIYENAGPEPDRLVKAFSYIGQQLTDTQNLYDEKNTIIELFPINKSLILEKKTSELWLFRVVDYLFQQSSMKRYPLLDNIFLYIDQHIKEEITLNKIIENCAVSQGYLSRIFRSQFHVSVTEYLHMKKMHLAKGYFYFTEDSIGEVAFRLGYSESSYFSRVFKKYENMTVKEYKNKIKK